MSEVKKKEVKPKGRIIWASSSPFVGDACGKQSHYVCKGFTEAGYDVDYLAWNWDNIASSVVYDFDGTTLIHPYGINAIISGGKKLYNLHSVNQPLYESLLSSKPTAVITLGDFQTINQFGSIAAKYNVPWYNWFPFDYVEWDMVVGKTFYELDCHLVTMADWGYKIASENFYQPAANIYHGVDTSIFKPANRSKSEVRKSLNLPEQIGNNFVVGFVGQNMERKRLDKLVESFALFAKGKNDVSLLCHTDPYQDDKINPSYPLLELIGRNGLESKFLYTHPVNYHMKYSDYSMANLYNSFNINLLPSSGEGFGVPVLECNACGVPSIMTNATSAQQLVGKGQGFLAEVSSTYVFRGFKRAMVNAESIAKWLNILYADPKLILQASATAVTDAQKYDFKNIQADWVRLIEKR